MVNCRLCVPHACLLALFMLIAVLPAALADQDAAGSGAGVDSESLTPAEQRELRNTLSKFRSSRATVEDRMEVVDSLVAKGPQHVAALFPLIERQLAPRLERYRALFHREAGSLAAREVRNVDPGEVHALRRAVLALKERPDLTKEMIKQVGDPGIERLRALLLVQRENVLAASSVLEKEREELSDLGQMWEKCARVLYAAVPEEERPDEPPGFDAYLVGEETLAAGLASPMPPANRQILAANARIARRLDREEARAITALNLMRTLLGLDALMIDLKLCAAARDHSSDMKRLEFFDHTSPVPGKTTPWDRAERFGTSASGENIAMGYVDGNAANLGWFHSPGHHKNMLGDHRRVGVGRVGTYYTQLFGR